jgi:hypothetical protein
MKTLKLKKLHYGNLEKLLKDCELIVGNNAYPQNVFMSPNDLKKVKLELTKQFKKQYPYISKNKLKCGVGMHFLNLSPSELKGVKDGYVVYKPLENTNENK